jgi:O-antigen/teichoic acid export membrane protein
MADTPPLAAPARRVSPRVLMVGGGSLVAALSTYVLNIIAARSLPVEQTTTLLTNLALLFFFYGIVVAVTTEFTRSVAAAAHTGVAAGPPAWAVTIGIALAAGLTLAFTFPLWGGLKGTAVSLPLMLLMAAGVVGYTVHSGICGVLAGAGRWGTMSMLVGSEGTGRVVFALVVLAVGATADGFLGSVVAAAFIWVIFVASSPVAREALRLRLDAPLRVQLPRFGAAFAAQAASVALTVSFPVLLAWTTPAAEYATSAPLLVAISLTRAPLMVPLMAYQSMILAHVVQAGSRATRSLAVMALAVIGVGLIGGLLAWAIGPFLLTWLVSSGYFVDGRTLALLTLSAAVLALVTLTGAVAQALSLHRWFVLGWLLALCVSVGLLFVPGSLSERAILSLSGGPLAGCIVHTWAIFRASRSVAGPDRQVKEGRSS